MKKKVTESQLKSIIRKTISESLSELDWKTYSNAAGKLYGKAREGFGKYGSEDGSPVIPNDSEHGKLFARAERLQGKANSERNKTIGEPNYKTNPKWKEEFDHLNNGDYEYRKGEGWKLKGISESKLRSMISKSIKNILKESFYEEEENASYEDWSRYLNGKEPLFEFADGIVYVDYDEASGCLCSGYVTNIGFHKDGEVEVPVEGGDFQSALEEVYYHLAANHEEMNY